jgi:hypothetical protein
VQDYRVDERSRQAARRARRRVSSNTTSGCHALPSHADIAELQRKLLALWDTEIAMSRATLQRKFAAVARSWVGFPGTSAPQEGALSRATLGPE